MPKIQAFRYTLIDKRILNSISCKPQYAYNIGNAIIERAIIMR